MFAHNILSTCLKMGEMFEELLTIAAFVTILTCEIKFGHHFYSLKKKEKGNVKCKCAEEE